MTSPTRSYGRNIPDSCGYLYLVKCKSQIKSLRESSEGREAWRMRDLGNERLGEEKLWEWETRGMKDLKVYQTMVYKWCREEENWGRELELKVKENSASRIEIVEEECWWRSTKQRRWDLKKGIFLPLPLSLYSNKPYYIICHHRDESNEINFNVSHLAF